MRNETKDTKEQTPGMEPVEMLISKYRFSENLRTTWKSDPAEVIRMVSYSLPEEGQHEFWSLYDGH